MGYSYTVEESLGLARVVWSGDVTPAEAGAAIQAIGRDPRVRPNFCRLVDMRNARVQIPKASNRELAATNAASVDARGESNQRGKTAIVVGDELSFGIASQYAAYAELQGVPTEVFKDIAAAEKWLMADKTPTTPAVKGASVSAPG